MDMNDIKMISPCGVDCADCAAHRAGNDPAAMDIMLSLGFKKETLPCPGCRELKGNCPVIGGHCETYACFEKKGQNFCYECAQFPCVLLAPTADKAATAIHNIKLFNLSYIQKHGVKAWNAIKSDIKKRYFQGKLIYGKGPQC
jgi:hypothetical protein